MEVPRRRSLRRSPTAIDAPLALLPPARLELVVLAARLCRVVPVARGVELRVRPVRIVEEVALDVDPPRMLRRFHDEPREVEQHVIVRAAAAISAVTARAVLHACHLCHPCRARLRYAKIVASADNAAHYAVPEAHTMDDATIAANRRKVLRMDKQHK